MNNTNVNSQITVAIVAYKNYAKILRELKSIVECSSDKYIKEYIIVDNTDEFNSKLIEEKKKLVNFKKVQFINNEFNIGFGAANNIALKNAKTKYFAILNPDLIFKEDSFGKLMNFLENEHLDVVVPKLVDKDDKILPVYRRDITLIDLIVRSINFGKLFEKRKFYHTMQDKDFERPFNVPFAQGSFLFGKTDIFRKVNGFDERYFMYMEDADLCKRLNEFTNIVYCPYTKVIHEWVRGSHRNMKLMNMHIQSMIKYFKKWGIK
ncbi:MAG: glycosyltransferase family 2 protein [Limosilactobacillus mucosae]